MSKNRINLSELTEKAAARLSTVINFGSILRYAAGLRNPHDIEVITTMLLRLGLSSTCDRADVSECLSFLDDIAESLYTTCIVSQKNTGCQQFFGTVTNPIAA